MISLLLIIGGVLMLSWTNGKLELSTGVLWAVATGTCIAMYTVADGVGSRTTINALTFAGYQCIIDGITIFIVAILWRPGKLLETATFQWR